MFAQLRKRHAADEPFLEQNMDRITLHAGDAHLLPSQVCRIEVLSGSIWMSYRLEDIVLHASQDIALMPGGDRVVVTSLGQKPARIQIELA